MRTEFNYNQLNSNRNECSILGGKNNTKKIEKGKEDIQDILNLAINDMNGSELRNSAKKFRQIASILMDIDTRLNKEKKYSDRNSLNDLSGKEWIKHTKSWMIYDGRPKDIPKGIKNHPGSYPPDLAAHFIEFFTKDNDWVLDPFSGIGSTLVACNILNRNFWGTELNEQYCNFAKNRTEIGNKNKNTEKKSNIKLEVFNADARDIFNIWKENNLPQVDFVVTSPPYWNILEKSRGGVNSTHKKRVKSGLDEKYSENPLDLANSSDYNKYLDEITDIFRNVHKILKEGAYVCVIVQNFRPKDGIMKPLAWDIAYRLREIYKLRQEFIWCQNQKFLGIWGYPSTFISNVHHHYCLIFQK